MTSTSVSAGEPRFGLFCSIHAAGRHNWDMLREIPSEERNSLLEAMRRARLAASTTPYHRWLDRKRRFIESLQSEAIGTGESDEVLNARSLAAYRDLLQAAAATGKAWRDWVSEFLGEDAGSLDATATEDAVNAYESSGEVQIASELLRAPDLLLRVEGPNQARAWSDALGKAIRAHSHSVALERGQVDLLAAYFGRVDAELTSACRAVFDLAAESMTGDPFIWPIPATAELVGDMTMTLVDVTAARNAQVIAWQARQHAKGELFVDPPTSDRPTNPEAPPLEDADDASQAQPSGQRETEADPAETRHSPLTVNLNSALEAVVQNVHGLRAEWGRRFPPNDAVAAIMSEAELLHGVVGQVMASLEKQAAAAAVGGHSVRLAGPTALSPFALAQWSSNAEPESLWEFQSTASIFALQAYAVALEMLKSPEAASFTRAGPVEMRFGPASVEHAHAATALVADVCEEGAATISELTGTPVADLGIDAAPDREVARLAQLFRVCQENGMPEAAILYGVRVLRLMPPSAAPENPELMAAATNELGRIAEGERAYRSVALGLAAGVTELVSAALKLFAPDVTSVDAGRVEDTGGGPANG